MRSKINYGMIIDVMKAYDLTIEEVANAMEIRPITLCKRLCGLSDFKSSDFVKLASNYCYLDVDRLINIYFKDFTNKVVYVIDKDKANIVEYLLHYIDKVCKENVNISK